jgi:hypothetical protein
MSWQMVLSRVIDITQPLVPNVDVWDIDLFDTPAATIAGLKAQGKKVVCYFSAGSADTWRPDYWEFTDADKTFQIPGWSDQYYVNIKTNDPTGTNLTNVWSIMLARIQLAQDKGCDAIDPDNTGMP